MAAPEPLARAEGGAYATPLHVALDIQRLISRAQAEHRPLDVSACAAELFLRFIASGCTRRQIAEALEGEAAAAGLTLH